MRLSRFFSTRSLVIANVGCMSFLGLALANLSTAMGGFDRAVERWVDATDHVVVYYADRKEAQRQRDQLGELYDELTAGGRDVPKDDRCVFLEEVHSIKMREVGCVAPMER